MEQSTKARQVLRFGAFEVDIQERELRRSGLKVRIQEQPFQILALLLERPGAVVGREDLQKAVWPNGTFVDFERGLNTAVTKLREALGDEPENPRFIETVPRRGYRFIAAVNSGSGIGTLGVVQVAGKSATWGQWIGIAFLLTIVIAVLAWALWRYPSRHREIIERKLTGNSSESSVSSAAISPDGKYLAYADNTGVSLKVIHTGEVRSLPLPPNFSARVDDWFPDGSHLLLSREERPGKASLWSMSVFGGSPRQLADDAAVGSVSPDGAHIAFRRGDLTYWGLFGREEWVMNSDGTELVKVAGDKGDGSDVGAPTWSPDGKRIAYIRTKWAYNARTSSVEINEWRTGNAEILFSDNALSPALHWLKDGRLIYALGSTQHQQDSTLWVVSLQQSGRLSSRPKRITGAHGWISQVTGSADGKVVIFLRGDVLPSVYIAGLAADGIHLLANRRLTLDENENIPWSWTPDSKAVLFSSDRNGTREIFKQAIDQPSPENLVAGAQQLDQARLTPDGQEILYISTPKPSSPEALSSIFAIPIGGGTPRLVLKDTRIWNVQCARAVDGLPIQYY